MLSNGGHEAGTPKRRRQFARRRPEGCDRQGDRGNPLDDHCRYGHCIGRFCHRCLGGRGLPSCPRQAFRECDRRAGSAIHPSRSRRVLGGGRVQSSANHCCAWTSGNHRSLHPGSAEGRRRKGKSAQRSSSGTSAARGRLVGPECVVPCPAVSLLGDWATPESCGRTLCLARPHCHLTRLRTPHSRF